MASGHKEAMLAKGLQVVVYSLGEAFPKFAQLSVLLLHHSLQLHELLAVRHVTPSSRIVKERIRL